MKKVLMPLLLVFVLSIPLQAFASYGYRGFHFWRFRYNVRKQPFEERARKRVRQTIRENSTSVDNNPCANRSDNNILLAETFTIWMFKGSEEWDVAYQENDGTVKHYVARVKLFSLKDNKAFAVSLTDLSTNENILSTYLSPEFNETDNSSDFYVYITKGQKYGLFNWKTKYTLFICEK